MTTSDEAARLLDNQVRKGFMSILVLYTLKDDACHGYKIQQKIKDLTNGVWEPPLSTIYRNLAVLADKGLIRMSHIAETGNRKSKEYAMTTLGTDTLGTVVENLKDIIKTMRAVVLSFYGLDVDYEPDGLLW